MPPEQARGWVMRFGKYKGKTLAEIAAVDVLYLDWLRSLRPDSLNDRFRVAVDTMCRMVEHEIDAAMERRGR